MSQTIKAGSLLQQMQLSGRWITGHHSSLSASWAGSSITFEFHGSLLSIDSGTNTERKDRSSTTPMIGLSVGPDELSVFKDPSFMRVLDVIPNETIDILDRLDGKPSIYFVRIMLIDWASTFELESLTTNDVSTPPHHLFNRRIHWDRARQYYYHQILR
ncbi:hypothetical protein RhiLY_11863 [Ceratobasidium sp. AG-Ba]|nr:hypothetical protein RhiLY_11863 [Ceratobasidium sp. AG-Ba]